jgi:hypothetical protein
MHLIMGCLSFELHPYYHAAGYDVPERQIMTSRSLLQPLL